MLCIIMYHLINLPLKNISLKMKMLSKTNFESVSIFNVLKTRKI
jgi:hypothetical protein